MSRSAWQIESRRFRDACHLLNAQARELHASAELLHRVENGVLKMPGSQSAVDSVEIFSEMMRDINEARHRLAPWSALFATVRRLTHGLPSDRMEAAIAAASGVTPAEAGFAKRPAPRTRA